MNEKMKRRKRAILISIVAILALALITFLNREWLMYRGMNFVFSLQTEPILGQYQYERQSINVDIDGQSIYGVAFIPQREQPVPLVLIAHGLGGTHTMNINYARSVASHGVAAYIFDFRGGSVNSRSDGLTTEMSIKTQADDIEAIMYAASNWDFVDINSIVLVGVSQGGYAAAIAAMHRPDEVAGLVMICPAFVANTVIYDMFSSREEIPQEFNLMGWINVGHNYAYDIWGFDIFNEITNYTGPVLLIHGDADDIVDISYSERAAEAYENAELRVIPGAGHAILGDGFTQTVNYILDFLAYIGIISRG